MPSATVGNNAPQSASPDLGCGQTSGNQTEALKQVLGVIDKKVRNMEKKKGKLDDYQVRKSNGERLNQDQLEALSKAQEVTHNLEFARELQKSFLSLNIEIQKAVKKTARREQLRREEVERSRLKAVLEVQFLLEQLGEERVRQELSQATGDGDQPPLTPLQLSTLDEFYKLLGPDRDPNARLADHFEEPSMHLWELLEGRDKPVGGTTYKALKETLDSVLRSGYFDRTQSHQNGVCTEEEQQPAPAESSETDDQPAEPEGSVTQEFAETVEVEATEFVNRQFVPEAAYSGSDNGQAAEWTTGTEVQEQQQQPTAALSPASGSSEPPTLPPADPLVRKQVVQDLMAQMQGTYNFMQDSMLEFDGAALDPAIVSAQPMKPAQLVCAPAHADSRLSQHAPAPAQTEPAQVPMVSPPSDAYSSSAALYQPPHNPDPRPQSDHLDPHQVSIPLSSEHPAAPSPLTSSSQPQGYQPVSKPLHSGINVNAAPFQSMQTVFNMNAPVPPSNEVDPQKLSSQYQSSYGQAFSSQAAHSSEQTDIQVDPLQSVGAFHSQDPGLSSQQASGQPFARQGVSMYTGRAIPRAGPRNPRGGALNGYRAASNTFRGAYDGYRAPFPNTPNTGYGQAQFSTPRDFNNSYPREGFQSQSFKRGVAQGPRGSPRGRGGPYRYNRGMATAQIS